ncbi:hypothetical protein K488DRAFT_50342 [Vararia minispora EC-137]|uniref:Uncharacterized protein n=1 Tax=Vararia minispora EC-137 TaxID=1314806 RepID=A0ACB8QKS3_9AGAM|nr:hypothetical protein K488DRAFT_50342 [Vararia minispora EC-137]
MLPSQPPPPPSKRRPRASQKAEDISNPEVLLDRFRANARLMSYDDLNGSNVRLPVFGLSVTGPLSEAVESIPESELRTMNSDDYIIALCGKREMGGIEFIPYGLESLGLCQTRAFRPPPGLQTDMYPTEGEAPVLTAIGRAVVEMVWLACLSLTSFEPSA